MDNKIILTTFLSARHELEIEPEEIESIEEVHFVNSRETYCIVVLKPTGDDNYNKNRVFNVWEPELEIKSRIRQLKLKNRYIQTKFPSNSHPFSRFLMTD